MPPAAFSKCIGKMEVLNMCRILLLTKCVYANQELEQTIRRLGHEVLSSVSLIDLIKNGQVPEEFIREFHPILLSETIPN